MSGLDPGESTARRRDKNAAVERREARRPRVMGPGHLRRTGDGPDREAGHQVRRIRTSACRRSAPLILSGRGKTKGQPGALNLPGASRWLFDK
jgi:hypothetical protein